MVQYRRTQPQFRDCFLGRLGEKELEASGSIEIAKHILLSCGLILAIGTVTGLLAQKIQIPDVAVFLIVGMAIGPEAVGLINIKADSALNQIILLFGASYILFDGGASLRFSVLKRVWITIVVIATVGVVKEEPTAVAPLEGEVPAEPEVIGKGKKEDEGEGGEA